MKFWDTLLHPFEIPNATKPCFIHDSYLIYRDADGVQKWEIETEKKETLFSRSASVYDISLDCSLFAVAIFNNEEQSNEISLRDFPSLKELDKANLDFAVNQIRISPDGKYLVCSALFDKLSCWKISEGRLHLLWQIPQRPQARGLSLKNTLLDEPNRLFLSQLGANTGEK